MWIAGGIGLLASALLVLPLPRVLPFAADTHVAAIVMGQDRWNAGVTMMRAADPEGWRGVVGSSQLVRDNAEAIGKWGQNKNCSKSYAKVERTVNRRL